jgi:PLP dependent protein
MTNIASSIQSIQQQVNDAAVRSGRSADQVTIVAVSKTKPAQAVRDAYAVGMRVFGENRIQEAEGKIAELNDLEAQWHLIGHLQTNKVKKVIPLFTLIHSVDSPKLIKALESEAAKHDATVSILLQLNLSGEESKFGADISELEKLLSALQEAPHLLCKGLMTIPPFVDDPEDVRQYFRNLRELGEQYHNDIVGENNPLELSMGMTNDFQVAIEEGSTMVRIGTAIFGGRY